MKNKLLKGIGITALVILLLPIITWHPYIYKGAWCTYLQGQTGPGIYDQDYFASREVPAGKPMPWPEHPSLGQFGPSTSQREYMDQLNTAGFMVAYRDTIVYEEYFDEHGVDVRSNSFSMAKSVISLLISAAVDDGYIESIQDPAAKYLSIYDDGERDHIRIVDFLSMSSGLEWQESDHNPWSENAEAYYGWDLHGLMDEREVVGPAGEMFDYKSGDTQVLGLILENATGMTVSEYASKKLWSKLGTEHDAFWSLDTENGDEKAYCCLYATTRDFGRLGSLVNHGGRWNGQQLVNPEYYDMMLSPYAPLETNGERNKRYGLCWWILPGEKPVYYARGMLGQYVFALPDEQIIIVRTGANGREPIVDGTPRDILKWVELGRDVVAQVKKASS